MTALQSKPASRATLQDGDSIKWEWSLLLEPHIVDRLRWPQRATECFRTPRVDSIQSQVEILVKPAYRVPIMRKRSKLAVTIESHGFINSIQIWMIRRFVPRLAVNRSHEPDVKCVRASCRLTMSTRLSYVYYFQTFICSALYELRCTWAPCDITAAPAAPSQREEWATVRLLHGIVFDIEFLIGSAGANP
jgi:hypothetical protein